MNDDYPNYTRRDRPPTDSSMSCVLVIPLELHQRIAWYTRRCPVEIGGLFGFTLAPNDGTGRTPVCVMTDMMILPQEGSFALVTLEDEHVMRWIQAKYAPGEKRNIGWWHSHVDMGCTPSFRDLETTNALCKMGGVALTLIVNKSDEYSLRLDTDYNGVPIGMSGRRHLLLPPTLTEHDKEEMEQEYITNVNVTGARGGKDFWKSKDREEAKELEERSKGNSRVAKAYKSVKESKEKKHSKHHHDSRDYTRMMCSIKDCKEYLVTPSEKEQGVCLTCQHKWDVQ